MNPCLLNTLWPHRRLCRCYYCCWTHSSRPSPNAHDHPSSQWYARPGCPKHRRPALECAVNALPVEWLDAPVSGEVFESIIECERRLRSHTLAEGFDELLHQLFHHLFLRG